MKWFFITLFSLFGILILGKGFELWTVMKQVDEEGIAISFFGIEIIEFVVKESIPGYVLGFTMASMIPILMAITFVIKTRHHSKNKQQEI